MTDLIELRSLFSSQRIKDEHSRTSVIRSKLAEGVLFFGAGNTGREVARLNKHGNLHKVLGFVDDTPGKDGTHIEGIPVYSRSSALSKFGSHTPLVICVFKAGVFFKNVQLDVTKSGFSTVISLPDYIRATGNTIPFYYFSSVEFLQSKYQNIESLHSKLFDEKSKEVLRRWINFRLYHDYENMDQFDKDIYFPDFLPGKKNPTFCMVDCGAYDGDSITRLLSWRDGLPVSAIAFEPDPSNLERLKTQLSQAQNDQLLELQTVAAAVGENEGFVNFLDTNDESAHVVSEGGRMVNVVTVDQIVSKTPRPYYVKYDVEGYEKESLRGTQELIKYQSPSLAISVYHLPGDLWELPEIILDWNPKYKLYLRSHGEEGMDTVLYAIPE
ncbi:FkbM family methyltransferase [Thalassospira tepidiphila]|uniref:FkbM family methyltransferase n=1 Tax=Thalassospira tepidiphila TaxID=393657 RepID=UPI003AA9D554